MANFPTFHHGCNAIEKFCENRVSLKAIAVLCLQFRKFTAYSKVRTALLYEQFKEEQQLTASHLGVCSRAYVTLHKQESRLEEHSQ